MISKRLAGLLCAVSLCTSLPCSVLAADMTLTQALLGAYQTSAELEAARARLLATEEGIDLARSGYRPTVRGDAIIGRRKIDTEYDAGASALSSGSPGSLGGNSLLGSSTDSGTTTPKAYQISASQTIFDGFKTLNAIDRSKAEALAAQQAVRDTESRVLLAAATAFWDVARDQEILSLRETFSAMHDRELTSLEKRFNAYDATNADVAQTEARRARARGLEELARANLEVSRSRFALAVGHEPSRLGSKHNTYEALLPPSLEAAQVQADAQNPTIGIAVFREAATRHAIGEIRGDLLPQLAVEGTYVEAEDPSVGIKRTSEALVYGRLTIPFYDAGATYARLRQAKHQHLAAQHEMRQARAVVTQSVAAAWTAYTAARSQMRTSEVQLAAAGRAVESIRREAAIAARMQSDILNAEQERIEARVAVATARREVAVAAFSLLTAVGGLSAEVLALDGERSYSHETHIAEIEPLVLADRKSSQDKWDRVVALAVVRSEFPDHGTEEQYERSNDPTAKDAQLAKSSNGARTIALRLKSLVE